MRTLCRLEDVPDGGARGFGPGRGGFTGLFAVRRGERVFVYVNSCPHVGAALDPAPGAFLTRDGGRIVCGNHGALFDVETGVCVQGPCEGERLEAVAARIEDGAVLAPDDAGL